MYVCVCMVQYVRMCVYGTVCTYVCVWYSMYVCTVQYVVRGTVQYVRMCVYGTVCTYVCVWYSMYVCVCMVQYVRMCVYGTVCTYVCVWYSMYVCVCMVQHVRMCVYGTVCTYVCVLMGALRATSFVKTHRYRTAAFCTCVHRASLSDCLPCTPRQSALGSVEGDSMDARTAARLS